MTSERTARLARTLLWGGAGLESGGPTSPIDDDQLVKAISRRMAAEREGRGDGPADPTDAAVAAGLTARARGALDRLDAGTPPDALPETDLASLEAIVMLTGRPPLRFIDGKVEMPPDIGENQLWRVLIAEERDRIDSRAASVGLIAREPPNAPVEPLGTGWRLGDNLVVTNRHVARLLADHPDDSVPSWSLDPALTSSVDFWAVTQPTKQQRYRLTAIAWCSATHFPDLAVLEFALDTQQAPAPLALDWNEASLGETLERQGVSHFRGRQIYALGHPYRAGASDPVTQVFGKADGRKRCAPGLVTAVRGATGIFEHDCSTLRGNSGSCMLSAELHAVVGVHFAGLNVGPSDVGTSNAGIVVARLAGTEAGEILTRGRV